jgi:hypothetical protein
MATVNGKCQLEDKNFQTWTTEWDQDIDFSEYTIPKNYTAFYVFISALDYLQCRDNLMKTEEYNAKFYEIYGTSDFLTKEYRPNSSFEELNDFYTFKVLPDKTVPEKKSIVDNIEYYKILETYIFNKNCFEKKIDFEKKEFNIDKRNMINAFILLNKKNEDGIDPPVLLKFFSNDIDSDLLRTFVFRVYTMENKDQQKKIMLYLNVDCGQLTRLNKLTTQIDHIVDDHNYEKTTLISTKKHFNDQISTKFPQMAPEISKIMNKTDTEKKQTKKSKNVGISEVDIDEKLLRKSSKTDNRKGETHLHIKGGDGDITVVIGTKNSVRKVNKNKISINKKQTQSLKKELAEKGVSKKQADELIEILKVEELDIKNKILGPKAQKWCENVKTVTLNVLSNLIFTVMYGSPFA